MSENKNQTLIIIGGPTASGKTSLAIEVAKYFNTEIISADSRQIYKELNIGVAKPSKEELLKVKHHFVGSHSIYNVLNAYDYGNEATKKVESLFKKHDVIVMVGGSNLFLKAFYHGIDTFPDPTPELREELNDLKNKDYQKLVEWLKELDPEYYKTVDKKNPARVQRAIEVCLASGDKYSNLRKNNSRIHNFSIMKFAIMPDRQSLDENIALRLQQMRKIGLTQEAKELEIYKNLTPLKTIGYQELFDFFANKITEDEAYEKIRVNTRRYAKKQMTWIKKEQDFLHVNSHDSEKIINCINIK